MSIRRSTRKKVAALAMLIFVALFSGCTTTTRRYDLDKKVWVEERLGPREQLRIFPVTWYYLKSITRKHETNTVHH